MIYPGHNQSERGYSVIEMLMVTAVMTVVASMAAFQIGVARPGMKGDGAMRTIIGQLNMARELAITQRRNMEVQFVGNDVVQIVRRELPAGTTVLSRLPLEGGLRYGTFSGMPDTPDGFGASAGVSFGTATALIFGTDGSLVNQLGTPVSGTVFLGMPGTARSYRAITVMGATGRIRGFKWNGRVWVRS